MNSAGEISPRVGCVQRISASAPIICPVVEIDLRLVVQRELLALQRPAQALFDRLPLHGARVHRRLEELIALAAVFLGLVHRGVGVLDQRLGIQAVVGVDADADADGDVQIVLVDRDAAAPRPAGSGRR